MTVTLELRPDELAALNRRASAEGTDIEGVLHGLIAGISAPTKTARPQTPALTEKHRAAVALMHTRRQEDQTEDAEELAERDRELREFKANINRWRAEQGQPPAFESAE